MLKGFFKVPEQKNEPVKNYSPGSPERKALQLALAEAREIQEDIPMYIGGEKVFTDKKIAIHPPHDHQHILGYFHEGDTSHVEQAINAALGAKEAGESLPWKHRAPVFLKAADLIPAPYK